LLFIYVKEYIGNASSHRHLYEILVGKLKGKRPLEMSRRRWEDGSEIVRK